MLLRSSLFALIAGLLVASGAGADDSILKVALFPYVPNPKEAATLLATKWSDLHPDIKLEFIEWDGYDQDPPSDLDVFEFDSILLDHFVRNSFLQPLSLEDITDDEGFYEFALRGSMVDGTPYAVPRLACTPVLFYRRGDTAIENVTSIAELHALIGDSPDVSPEPEVGKGLLIDLAGGTTCACIYLDALADTEELYSYASDLQPATSLNGTTITNLTMLTRMAGKKHATCRECYDKRAPWFSEGKGRVFVGWTERLAFMDKQCHPNIRVRSLPLADTNKFNLFFVDMLGINSRASQKKRELALQFINMATSHGVMLETLLIKQAATGSPQYLLPTRPAVVKNQKLRDQAPLYEDIEPILESNPNTFRLPAHSRQWLSRTKGEIRKAITSP